eukprot:SAG11_NODE_466_length_9212_cov_2.301986_6_plen_39_part_00
MRVTHLPHRLIHHFHRLGRSRMQERLLARVQAQAQAQV